MKKIITLIAVACFSLSLSAQYYYYPFVLIGQNPGGLNTSAEQPSQAGWTSIQDTSSVPAWSPVQTLPFTFSLGGTPFTSYKVSTSGVMTFTTGAASVPSSTNAALPDASIPDNSICVWGLAAIGTNDRIMTRTYGSSPNRQYWVQFNSYSAIGSVGTNWTYWGIVLEETTNKIYIVDQRTYNTPISLSVGIQINSTTAYSVSGSPNVTSYTTLAANLDDPTDNSYYEFTPGTMPVNDARLTTLTNLIYVVAPGSVNITGSITNFGSATITSIPVKYQSGANVYTSTISTSIATAASANFTHSIPLSIPTAGTSYPVKVWVELSGDNNHVNDTLNTLIYGAGFMPSHTVVMEEATGTWCGWCPRGTVYMDSLATAYPSTVVPIVVHSGSSGEPMRNAVYGAAIEGSVINGYPTIYFGRKYQDDPSNGFAQYAAHLNDFGFADMTVTVNYNSVTRDAATSVTVNPAITITGTYRLAAVFTEDGVTGTGDGSNAVTADYDQENYYSGGSYGPLVGAGHTWDQETNPVPATNMVYNFVARNIQGGFTGQAGSLPATLTANTPANYTFANYTIPANYNVANMKVHVLLIDVTNNTIVNGKTWAGFPTSVPAASASASFNFNVYPNPAHNMATLEFQLPKSAPVEMTITNVMGQVVYHRDLGTLNAGVTRHSLNTEKFTDGIYNVTVVAGDKTFAHKFVVNR